MDWGKRAEKGFLGAGIDPKDSKGYKNYYIDILQKKALEQVINLRGDEIVLDFGCGGGRIAYWIAPRVKKVIGLEITPEMITLAEKNRTADNVEFILYDGTNFPEFPFYFDLILSIGVIQIMKGKELKRVVSQLANYLGKDGKGYFIEQVTDNPKIERPSLSEYLEVFQESNLKCIECYPIRRGRWWMLYLIRYGLIPKEWFFQIALKEMISVKRVKRKISYYQDYLFILEKNGSSS